MTHRDMAEQWVKIHHVLIELADNLTHSLNIQHDYLIVGIVVHNRLEHSVVTTYY